MSHFHEHTWDDSDDSEDDILPLSGFSQNRDPNAFRRLVIEDSSSDEGSEHSVHAEEVEDETYANLSRAMDTLALSSQSQPALAPHREQDTERNKEVTIVTSITEESHVETSEQKPSTHVDNESPFDDSLEHESTHSTVEQGGRFKTPKRKPPMDEPGSLGDSLEHDDTSTVVQEGRIKTPKRKPPMDETDDDSLDDSLEHDSMEDDDTSTVVQEGRVKTPKRKPPMDDTDDESLDDSLEHDSMEDDDTSTVVQEGRIKTPKRKPPMDDTDDESLDDSLEHDDTSTVVHEGRIKTPKRKPPLDEDDERSFGDSSLKHDDKSTAVQEGRIETPRKLMMRKFIEALDDSTLKHNATLLVQGGHATVREQSSETDSLIDEGSVELIDSDGEALKSPVKNGTAKHNVSFGDDFENSAWALDAETDEVFLSADQYANPNSGWPKLRIPIDLYNRLYNHQKAGVQWMASLHSNRIGGILGDDMGMGKTYQTLTYLGGLMRTRTIRNALVIAPLSVLRSWEKEAEIVMKRSCVPKLTIYVVQSETRKDLRCRMLREALSCSAHYPYLVITTYGLISSNPPDFVSEYDDWNVVVLDEGHKIKNSSAQVSNGCRRICQSPETQRIMLTGTPIQNNLKELWALFDWATSGKVLGKLKCFVNQYARPIEDGRNKNASPWTIEIAEKANKELQLKLRPYFLQRMKQDFLTEQLPTKRELVVWTHLSSKQRKMYETYVEKGDKVASVLAGEVKSPLEAVTWLKKLSGHPLLVESTGQYDRAVLVDSRKPEDLRRESAKLEVLVSLVERLQKSGHRILIFSQSTRMLDIIERVLCQVRLSRIDGSTKGKDRQTLIESFNSQGSNLDVMLLSTKAAGLGLTLTGADRAVIYDPSWNPAEDSQAVDRCYRIGQTKDVTVYRLISAGTVEEKIYEKQVHKDGIRRAVMTRAGNATERYFDKKDLRKLFQLAPAGTCEVLAKLQTDHRVALGSSGKPTFLESHAGVVGVSCHDGIYAPSEIEKPCGLKCSTPFGGTPANVPRVTGRSQKVLSKIQIDFSAADNKENGAAGNLPPTPDRKVAAMPMSKDTELSGADVGVFLDEVDVLKTRGDLVDAMNILLELVENPIFLDKKQKLRMHQGLAEIGSTLGWLHGTSR